MMVPPRIRLVIQSKLCKVILWLIAIPILFVLAIASAICTFFVTEAVMPTILFGTIGAIGIEQVKELLTPPYRED
jgi:hypothetical protein